METKNIYVGSMPFCVLLWTLSWASHAFSLHVTGEPSPRTGLVRVDLNSTVNTAWSFLLFFHPLYTLLAPHASPLHPLLWFKHLSHTSISSTRKHGAEHAYVGWVHSYVIMYSSSSVPRLYLPDAEWAKNNGSGADFLYFHTAYNPITPPLSPSSFTHFLCLRCRSE